ncbi:MAG: hypothetical protein WAK93_22405 [Solirubrobacteraceae bacterium]
MLIIALIGMLVIGEGSALGARATPTRPGEQSWAARILAPSSGAPVLRRSVRVVVALGPGVSSFQARLGSVVVTGAFSRSGLRRTATLRYGATRGLHFGENRLQVRTADQRGRHWLALTSFVVARPVGGLLRGAAAEPTCGTGPRVSVDLARPSFGLTILVNGGHPLTLDSGGRQRFTMLSADNGLRPGANSISLRVLDAQGGGYQQRRLHVTMPAGTPVAGAGSSRRASVGAAVSFDAGRSAPTRRGARLRYRWTIIQAPAGSHARVVHIFSARPRLRPDRPGSYVLQVTVSQRPRVPAPTAGLGSTNLLCSVHGTNSATTTMLATVQGGPIGVPVDTIASNGGVLGVQVGVPGSGDGGQFYPVPTPSDALQLVVLDRHSLGSFDNTSNQSFSNDQMGADQLLTAVERLPTGTNAPLVIITKPAPSVSNPGAAAAASTIDKALNAIGDGAIPAAVSTGRAPCGGSGQCSSFSAIGVRGIPQGDGHLNPGLTSEPGSGLAAGDLHGYFQQDFTGTATRAAGHVFVDTERVPFDTGDPTADPARVTIGSPARTYTSSDPGGPGFFVVVVDAGSLAPDAQGTFAVTADGLSNMHALLTKWEADASALILVRSIGTVKRLSNGSTAGPWDAVAGDLAQLGGSRFYFDALDGAADDAYAQVGPGGPNGGYGTPWTQVSSTAHNVTDPSAPADPDIGRLTGLLGRNNSAQLYPEESTAPGTSLKGSLPGLISLPSSSWPDRDTPGDQAALNCIAANVDPNGGLRTPIQDNYTNQNDVEDWAAWAGDLYTSRLSYQTLTSAPDSCTGFAPAELADVVAQLDREWNAVPMVWKLIGNMQAPLIDTQGRAPEVASVADDVTGSVQASSSVSYDPLAIGEDALWILSTVPGVSEVADPLNFLAGGLGLASDLNAGTDGSDDLSGIRIGADQLATRLQSDLERSISGLSSEGDILVSDWTKLQAAAQNAGNTTNAAADWKWQTPDYTEAANGLLLATRRQAYQTLFPGEYQLYRAQAGAAANSVDPNDVTPYRCDYFTRTGPVDSPTVGTASWYPFKDVPRFGGAAPVVSGEGTVEQWVYAGYNDGFLTNENVTPKLPSEDLLQKMFTDWTDQNGDQQPPLFNPLQFAVETYDSAGINTKTVTHVYMSASGGNTAHTNYFCQTS